MDASLKPFILKASASLGVIISAVAAIFSLLVFLEPSGWVGANRWTSAAFAGHWVLILFLGWMLLSSRPAEFVGIPKAVQLREGDVLLVRHCAWLSLDTVVAIFTVEDEFENFICHGTVLNVQLNGLVQIRMIEGPSSPAIKQKIEQVGLAKVLVKPGLRGDRL